MRLTLGRIGRNPTLARPRAPGFSLVELIVTAALIVIMFVMLYGHSSKTYQRKQLKACRANLQNIHVALQIYANDHEHAFPVREGATTSEEPLSLLVPKYTARTESFICPGSKDDPLPTGESFEKRTISYAYYMGLDEARPDQVLMTDEQVNTAPKAVGDPVFSSDGKGRGNNHNQYGGNYLRVDGSVEGGAPVAGQSLDLPQGVLLLNPRP